MDKKIGYIYVHTNKINGKKYVGKTIQEPSRRFRNGESYKSCTNFYRAIMKYGWSNFDHEVIFTVLDISQMNNIEEHFIKSLNTLAPNGYNLVTYDDGLIQFSDEIKQRLSVARHNYLKNLTEPLIAWNRKEHIIIDGYPHKQCSKCKELKGLNEYGLNSNTWDQKHSYCYSCWNSRARESQSLSKEDLSKSYKDRYESVKAGVIRAYENNPEIKERISKSKSIPLKATCIKTGNILLFQSGLDAKSKGYNNTNIGQAIKYKKVYRGYMWEKVEKSKKPDDEKYLIFNEERKNPVKSKIWDSIMNEKKKSIYARNCEIEYIDKIGITKEFLEQNHLQGYCVSSVQIGLKHQGELVALMTFGTPRYNKNFQYELLRFCNKVDIRVVGGASRLIGEFIKKYNPYDIISYANKRFSKGGLYEKLGFTHIGDSSPGYFYEKDGVLYNRMLFQKHKLKDKLEKFDPVKTERENMIANGFKILKDKGNLIYALYLKK